MPRMNLYDLVELLVEEIADRVEERVWIRLQHAKGTHAPGQTEFTAASTVSAHARQLARRTIAELMSREKRRAATPSESRSAAQRTESEPHDPGETPRPRSRNRPGAKGDPMKMPGPAQHHSQCAGTDRAHGQTRRPARPALLLPDGGSRPERCRQLRGTMR